MKKIILLSLMMVLGLSGVRGQTPFYPSNFPIKDTTYRGSTGFPVYCNNSMTFQCSVNSHYQWCFVSDPDSSNLGDSIYYISGDQSGFIKIITSTQYYLPFNNTDGSISTDNDSITFFNIPSGGTYYIYEYADVSTKKGNGQYCGPFFTESCVQLDGDSINEDSSFNTFCKNLPITIKNTTDTTLYFSNGDTVKSNSDFTLKNLSEGINNIEYGIGNTNYIDTIKFYGIDCLIDVVDTLSESIINNKNCVDGDSILNFKFNFTNNQNSDTDYYFNYSKFQWVIKDSIGKTVDSLVTKDDDEIFLNSLSGLKGNDTLYCTAMSEYFDTTVSISFTVNPYPTLSVSLKDTSTYLGDSVQLIANSDGSVTWSPSTGLSCTNCSNPIASPSITTTYTATATEGSCEVSDTILITVITTGINQIPVNNFKAYIYNGTLYLNDNKDVTVEVSDVLGHYQIYDMNNRNTLGLPSGFGIVTIYRNNNFLETLKFVNIE